VRSARLLAEAARLARDAGFAVAWVDATVIAERPRLAGFLARMEDAIAEALAVGAERVNVKVTSTDGLGAIGRGEGIAALAVVLLEPAR
jgi:2-C-methyl-D-erythritol 2,4-cyclodiphosphate synthase